MEQESPPRGPRKHGSNTVAGAAGPTARKSSRYSIDDEGGGGERIECSGKYCRSCSAALIADCVALCCCPCALLNLLTLAFVKVPWMVGRKCLGLGPKNKRSSKCRRSNGRGGTSAHQCMVDARAEDQGQGMPGEISFYGFDFEDEEEQIEGVMSSARLEAERVWLELYQVGHLGFGRVSFTGTHQSQLVEVTQRECYRD